MFVVEHFPGGLHPKQLKWLCEPKQIEQTLQQLWFVNHWAKDRERLLYVDRQGLYEVKATILKQAVEVGAIQTAAYVDGTAEAFDDLALDMAAPLAAENLIEFIVEDGHTAWEPPRALPKFYMKCPICSVPNLTETQERINHWWAEHLDVDALSISETAWVLGDEKGIVKRDIPFDFREEGSNGGRYWYIETLERVIFERQKQSDTPPTVIVTDSFADFKRRALALTQRIIGRDTLTQNDLDRLNQFMIEDWIKRELERLVEEARRERSQLSPDSLEDLLINPGDIMDVRTPHGYDWDDLGENDLRKLDAEGLSLIGFHYESETARYVFHLPYRIAAEFVPTDQIETLRTASSESREVGEYYGRALTEEESIRHPIRALLTQLGVNISTVCPKGLADKALHVQSRLAFREDLWDDEFDEFDDDDDLADGFVYQQPRRVYRPELKPKCRACKTQIEEAGLPRLLHWKAAHDDLTELTISKVSWIMGVTKDVVKRAIPHDYRAETKGHNVRYWKVSTVEDFLRQQS